MGQIKKTSLETDVVFYTYRKDINKSKQKNPNQQKKIFSLFGKQSIRQRGITGLATHKQTK